MASQSISDTIKDSFEMDCSVKLKKFLTHVSWWNKELFKLRVEVIKPFNRARNTSKVGDWKRFRESQHACRKVIVAKSNRWRRFCESIKNVSEASRLHKILRKENNPHLVCIKLPSGGYTESEEESLGHLMDVHFLGSQGPVGSSGERPMTEGGYKPREWRLTAKVVYSSVVNGLSRPSNPTRHQV
jgi:hypothetical protein